MKQIVDALLSFFDMVAFTMFLILVVFFNSPAGDTFAEAFNYMTGDFLATVVCALFAAIVVALYSSVQYLLLRLVGWFNRMCVRPKWLRVLIGVVAMVPVPVFHALGWWNGFMTGVSVLMYVVSVLAVVAQLDDDFC